MAVIAQDKAKLKEIIDKRLDDDTEGIEEIRAAASQYYLSLIQEDMENNEGMTLNESLDGNELAVLGFLRGYETCLCSHDGK